MTTPSDAPGPPVWRLIVEGSRDAAANMATDEALLERYDGPEPPAAPTLRLYGWRPAALSLGRKQPAAGSHDLAWLLDHGVDLVRRPTGGRAVLHEHERTYSVAGALRRPPFPGGVVATYRAIAAALVFALETLGLRADGREGGEASLEAPGGFPVCFDRPGPLEIVVDGRKVIGSAQVRRRGAFLQHGAILIRADAARLGGAIGVAADAKAFAGIADLLRRDVDPDDVDRAIVTGFERAFGIALEPSALTDEEALRAAQLRCWKYDSMAWTFEGRTGERERAWGPNV